MRFMWVVAGNGIIFSTYAFLVFTFVAVYLATLLDSVWFVSVMTLNYLVFGSI